MNKSNKAILLAILQDIKSALTGDISGSAASTASIAMSDIKRDGLDKQDLHNIAANSVLDQTGNVMDKIMLQFEQHPEIAEELDKFADENGLMQSESDDYLYDLGELIALKLQDDDQSKDIAWFKGGGDTNEFPTFVNGQKCDSDQCAFFQNDTLRNNGYAVYGNAWNPGKVVSVYSGYDINKRPTEYDLRAVEKYNADAADNFFKNFDSKTLDKSKKYIANMYYKGSPQQETAYYEGKDGIAGTHTGFVTYNNDRNQWEITHNIHGTIHVDPFTKTQGSGKQYGVTAIYEPKKKNFIDKIREVVGFGEGGQFESDLDTVSVKIGDKTYNLLYLVSEEEKEKGLQDVEDMDDSEGALFDYSDNPQESLSFWMKDTTIALTILFINKDGVVISSHDGQPLSEELITEEKEPVYWVIELNQSQRIPQGAYTNLALRQSPEEELEEDDEVDEDHPELKVNKLYIYGSDGEVQGEIDPGCRIFSRKSTEVIIRKAKKAYASKLDKDYKALGRYVFNEIQAQDNRPAEYV